MPKGYPKNKQPAEGGAIGGGESTAVRAQIREMLAPGQEEDFKDSLPEQTSNDESNPEGEVRVRRKRRTKEEIAREKGGSSGVEVDKRLERAKTKCAGLGAAGMVEAGFSMAGKGLNEKESEDVGDQFYLIAQKTGASADSWLFIVIYTVCLIAKLIMIRTQLGEEVGEWIKKMFEPKEEKQEGAQPQS